MKKSLFTLILLAGFSANMQASENASNPAHEQLFTAIKNVNLSAVKAQTADQVFTQREKDKLLESANKVVKLCEDNTKSLIKSKKDIARIIFGLALFAGGALIALNQDSLVSKIELNSELASSGISWKTFNQFAPKKKQIYIDRAKDSENKERKQKVGILQGFSVILCMAGIYSFVNGWTMSSAYNKLQTATGIKKLIEDIKVK